MRFTPIVAVMLLAGAMLHAGAASAQLPPTRFFGSIVVNGGPPEVGTLVEGFVNGLPCGQGIVQDLGDPIGIGYIVDVLAESFREGCGADGAIVTFRVGGLDAVETAEFRTGGFVEINLSVNGEIAPPPPPETPPGDPPPADPPPSGPPPSDPPPSDPPPEE